MPGKNVGVIHPGEMGAVVATTLRNSGHSVYFASEGRSPETLRRAAEAGVTDAGTVARMCELCTAIVSVCPPEFAEPLAKEVASHSFRGLYLDANAISPARARRMAGLMTKQGATFLDGCIIGMPARARGQTWLYASGENAAAAGDLFSGGPLEFEMLGSEVGQASALKMCFAAHSKGMTALLAAVMGAAEGLGVRQALERQWRRNGPNPERAAAQIRQAAPKAWRFVGEMKEIAKTFESASLPGGFPRAAEEIYGRMAGFKGGEPAVGAILAKLRG
ncbi:MAG: DUF1932 domain-containing protein [Acidobacteriia bacterium]|nr:DUF1932 domain-containing protein [Terriglobia bacterium]